MSELKSIVAEFARHTEPMALATAVRSVGSTYRKAGARLLLDAKGRLAGSMSSGCLEDEVAELARPVIAGGPPVLRSFDLRPRFGCNGTIEIFIERVVRGNAFLTAAAEVLAARTAWKVVTVFASTTRPLGTSGLVGEAPPDHEAFVQTVLPPVRVVVVGDGLDNEALVQIAGVLGWDIVLAATPADIPLPDVRTAIVVKAHKFGRDYAALQALLALPVAYVGLLGPARRKQQLLSMLLDDGLLSPNAPLAQLYGPAGIDVGAETPAEIALSIVAEIQAVLAGHTGGSLRDKRGSIHLPTRELQRSVE
ncbi:hypothetical protein AYO41_02315 [Verrucomicrobia bacterium SCGC AG-212-E04]|nr:hypothetical protein AYO41_02315 [Verrucomicrobia bacterium SCGC AG-212-E04]